MPNTENIVKVSHGDKLIFPLSGFTKADLFAYYNHIAPTILLYLKDRPLTLHRFPHGIGKPGFFQKNASDYFPDWIPRAKIKKKDGWVNHVVCNSKDTLLYLVNQGVITFHVGLSKIYSIDYPDYIIFDLDPPSNDFKPVIDGATILREFLESNLGLSSMVMTTGSRGLHVVVPIMPELEFAIVHGLSKKIANYLAFLYPKKFTTAVRKEQRKGLLFIDYLRNSYGQTAVSPFSVRAIEGMPIAQPLLWKDLKKKYLNARYYDISKVMERSEKQRDPWTSVTMPPQNLDKPIDIIEELANSKVV